MRKLFNRLILGLVIVFVLLITLSFLVPLNSYKPEIEAQLSKAINRQVIIGSVHARILPTLALSVKEVSIINGNETDGEIYVNRLDILPDLELLLKKQLVVREIRITGLAANQAFINSYLTAADKVKKSASSDSSFNIDRIAATHVTIRLNNGQKLGPFRIGLVFLPDASIKEIDVARMDNRANLTMSPHNKGFAVSLRARDWTLPIGPRLHFNKALATGMVSKDGLELPKITLLAYGGQLNGNVTTSWNNGWKIDGTVNANSVQMEPIIEVFNGKGMDGKFSGDVKLSLNGKEFKDLLKDPFIYGDFKIADGIISKPDQQRPAFVFDEVTGHGTLRNGQLSTRDVVMEAYSGRFSGNPLMSWSSGWLVKGRVSADTIEIAPLLSGFTENKTVAGKFSGTGNITLSADKFLLLAGNPLIDGEFRIVDGSIYKNGEEAAIFKFEELTSQGTLNNNRYAARQAKIHSYGGVISGDPTISWQDNWKLSGNLTASSINVEPFLSGFIAKKTITGIFNGSVTASLESKEFGDLLENPQLSSEFRFTDGVIYKADLEKASTHLSKNGTTGGQTPFEELRGRATINGKKIRLSKLKILSSSIEAKGDVDIDADSKLDGKIDVSLRNTASIVGIPLMVQGSTDEPHLRPTNAAVIGGAVGTGILGPGIGTAIGIKAANLLDKIGSAFKKKEE